MMMKAPIAKRTKEPLMKLGETRQNKHGEKPYAIRTPRTYGGTRTRTSIQTLFHSAERSCHRHPSPLHHHQRSTATAQHRHAASPLFVSQFAQIDTIVHPIPSAIT
jgi:hypothetical protein